MLYLITTFLFFVTAYCIFRVHKYKKEIQQLMKRTEIQPKRSLEPTPFSEDITATRPNDYNLSQFNPIVQKMLSTLPRRFSKIHLISKGGMGYVFGAYDRVLKRLIAIKMISPFLLEEQKIVKMFVNEARSVACLEHANIIKIHDVGGDAYPYFIMEFIQGIALKNLVIRDSRLPLKKIKHFGAQMADAFRYCHSKGVIHADIKPSNIIINEEHQTVKIIDFGIAKMTKIAQAHESSPGSLIMGSPDFMAPEHILTQEIDHLTDIYSFGMNLFVMTSGGPLPFPDTDLISRAALPPTPIKTIVTDIDKVLEYIIMKSIQKEKQNRFQSFNEIVQLFDKIDC